MQDYDVIVIGSGAAGAHAAAKLVESGATVLMIDGGKEGNNIEDPETDFIGLREERSDQWRWLLGEDLSGIPLSGLTGGLGGGQVSGNRGYVVQEAEKHLPLRIENGQVIQSLALGGLGAAWGATSAYFSAEELGQIGLPVDEMEQVYDEVTEKIGISGSPIRKGIDPPLALDHHATSVMEHYTRKKKWFDDHQLRVIQPHAAVLTKDKGTRKATVYGDLDYVADQGRSVYRPQYTVHELLQKKEFTLIRGIAVQFLEEDGGIKVTMQESNNRSVEHVYSARSLVLAAGAVGTARILLQSLNMMNVKLPFLGKHHVFSACLDLATFGSAGPRKRTSLCQLVMLDEQKRRGLDAGIAQLYSYRSLQLFRLLGSASISTPEALSILSVLSPNLVIADIRFPAFKGESTLSMTEKGINISLHVSPEEKVERMKSWKRLKRGLQKAGLLAVKDMWLPEASSSHYAGTIPTAERGVYPLTTDRNGKVHQCKSVWVADPSVFRCFPAKPHTLTIMANARRVAGHVLS